MADSENLVTTTKTPKGETHSQRTKLAKVKVSNHITGKGTRETMITINENLVIITDHFKRIMVIVDLVTTMVKRMREILVTGPGKKDTGQKDVEASL